MVIEIGRSMKVAGQVLAILRKQAGQKCYASVYLNGREAGWTVFPQSARYDHNVGVTFSECRNSDDIVLYCGTNPYTVPIHINDEAYRTKSFFRTPRAAALAAAAYLTSKGVA